MSRVVVMVGTLQEKIAQRVEFMKADIRDRAAVWKAVDGMDVVFHVASFGMSGRCDLPPPTACTAGDQRIAEQRTAAEGENHGDKRGRKPDPRRCVH